MLTIYAHVGKAIPDPPPEGTPEGPEKTRAREAFEDHRRRGRKRGRRWCAMERIQVRLDTKR